MSDTLPPPLPPELPDEKGKCEPKGSGRAVVVLQNEVSLSVLMHLLPVLVICVVGGLPEYTQFVLIPMGPLFFWLWRREGSAVLDEHGKGVLNFAINAAVVLLLCWVLRSVWVGHLLVPVVWFFYIVLCVAGAVKAIGKRCMRYPLLVRVVS
jgi:uncharacterized Tic20 family protein